MADNVAMYGFRPIRGRYADYKSQIVSRVVATGYQASPGGTDVDLHKYDPVKLVSDGSVALAVATEAVFGVIVGFKPYWNGTRMTPTNYLPGATAWGTNEQRRSEVLVLPVTGIIFEGDCDDAVTATTEALYRALVGENMDISTSADATLKKAFPKLDVSDRKTATAQCRIVGVGRRGNDDFSGANVKLEFVFNEVQEAPFTTAGI